jgi:hypothetical protein
MGISGYIDKVGTPEREMPHSSELTLFIQASPKRLHVFLLQTSYLHFYFLNVNYTDTMYE